MMRAAIYARYSAGPRQTDQSIDGQLRVCRAYCAGHDLEVIAEYCDRHITGTTDNRPEFQRMIADAKAKKFEALVVYKTDRLSRDKYDAVIYKRELKRAGVQIHYAAESIPEGPEGIILESLMEGLAEYYSAELAQKIRRGMHESALKCRSTGGGQSLGYVAGPDKTFIVDPAGAEAVRLIFDMYVKGESCADICARLNSNGFKTVRGGSFDKNSVNRIIKNRRYLGEYKYGDVVVPGGMPRLISDELFELAQAETEKRRTRKKAATPAAAYLLAGKLFCGHCLAPMHGVSGTGKSGKRFCYYCCANARGSAKTCNKKRVSKAQIEELVVELTCDYILNRGALQELVAKLLAYQAQHDDTGPQIALYNKKLAENKKASGNILALIEAGSCSITLANRLEALEAEQLAITETLAGLKQKRPAFTEGQILFMLEKYMEPAEGESPELYRKRIISCFVSEVYLYDDELRILFNISKDEGELEAMRAGLSASDVFDERLICSTTNSPGRTPEVKILAFGCSVMLVYSL